MNKQQLANKIWESANRMRSKIEANEYKDYILGFIFYKFLSDKEEAGLKADGWIDEDLELVTETNEEVDTKVLCLLEQAAALNSKEAMHRLGYIYENKGDYKKAKDYYAKAVALGCGDSAFAIADVIEKEFISNRGDTCKGSISWLADMSWGNLVLNEKEKEMLKEAVNWLLIAASLGNSTAMSIISNCYKFGVGVEKNEQLAKHWSSIGEICVGVVKRIQDELLLKY